MAPLHSQFIPAEAPIMPAAPPRARKRPSYGAPEKGLNADERERRAALWRANHAAPQAYRCADVWPPMLDL